MGLRKSTTFPVDFSLVVDDFGVKYVGDKHLDHIITELQKQYILSLERSVKWYLGILTNFNSTRIAQRTCQFQGKFKKYSSKINMHRQTKKNNPHQIKHTRNIGQSSNTPTIRICPHNSHTQPSFTSNWWLAKIRWGQAPRPHHYRTTKTVHTFIGKVS